MPLPAGPRAASSLPATAGRYGAAVALVFAGLATRWLLEPWLGETVPYLQFIFWILAAAWYAGFGPALVTTAGSALGAMYFVLPPAGFAVAGAHDVVSLVLFGATGFAIAAIVRRLRTAESARRAEALLATVRAERLDAIINTSVDGIIVIDHRGRIESFNPAAERLFGFTAAEVVGQDVGMLMPSPHREQHGEYLARYLATGEAKVVGIGREVSGQRRDGSMFPLRLSVGRFDVRGAPKFAGIVHDLTARVRLEQQIHDQAALAHVGEMAAVLAHEVKNPLAGIRGVLEVVRDVMPADGPDASLADEAIARIDSLDAMMRELLLFARPPQPRLEPTDVVALVATTARLLRQDRALDGVDIRVEGQAPPVPLDAEMLKVVLQNLLLNSADAMHRQGRIDIAVEVHERSCRIRLTDTGPGIPAELRERIFTPFFTTKAQGTGLGLPTARRFVEAHAGQIAVDCPPSGGTTIVVALPVDGTPATI